MWIQRLSELTLVAGVGLTTLEAQAAPPMDSERAQPDDDPLAAYRERFKRGMERYKGGSLAEAIGYWEPIYRELGEQKGYRLAYNLGVAYQELGDATHAAERLESFLSEVDTWVARGEPLAPIVERESVDARARIARLIALKGRIHVQAISAPRTAHVDASEPRLAGFVAWVTPGEHTVTFAEGTSDVEIVRVRVLAGEIVEVAPKPAPIPPPAPEQVTVSVGAPQPPAPVPIETHREPRHPFPWPLIAVTGGIAVAAGIAALPLYIHEGDLYARYSAESPRPAAHSATYDDFRTWAYTDVAGAIGFAAVTAGLATWYFLGTSRREIVLVPTVGPGRGTASLGLSGRF